MLTLRQRLNLAWRIIRKDESNSLRHAAHELELAFPDDSGDSFMPGWNAAMRLQCMEVLTVFAAQGNSGMSASIAINVLGDLMKQEPLTSLTGEDGEWCDVGSYGDGPGTMYQNRRCSHVFKDGKDGQAYTIEGYVFEEQWTDPETGDVHPVRFTGAGSRKAVAFPWLPELPVVVKVDDQGVPIEPEYRHLREADHA